MWAGKQNKLLSILDLVPRSTKVGMYAGEKEDNGIDKWIDKVN